MITLIILLLCFLGDIDKWIILINTGSKVMIKGGFKIIKLLSKNNQPGCN